MSRETKEILSDIESALLIEPPLHLAELLEYVITIRTTLTLAHMELLRIRRAMLLQGDVIDSTYTRSSMERCCSFCSSFCSKCNKPHCGVCSSPSYPWEQFGIHPIGLQCIKFGGLTPPKG